MGYTDTTHYKMKKPDATNKFDINDLNNALDTVDKVVFDNNKEIENKVKANDEANKRLIATNDETNKQLINNNDASNKQLIADNDASNKQLIADSDAKVTNTLDTFDKRIVAAEKRIVRRPFNTFEEFETALKNATIGDEFYINTFKMFLTEYEGYRDPREGLFFFNGRKYGPETLCGIGEEIGGNFPVYRVTIEHPYAHDPTEDKIVFRGLSSNTGVYNTDLKYGYYYTELKYPFRVAGFYISYE